MCNFSVLLTIGVTALAVASSQTFSPDSTPENVVSHQEAGVPVEKISTPCTSDTIEACAKVPASRGHIFNVVDGVVANKGSLQLELLSSDYIHSHVGHNSICH